MSNASIDLMVLRPGCPAPSDGSAWLSDSSSAGGTSPSASTSTSASAVASASPVREDGQAAKKRRRAPTPPAYPAAVLALPTDGSRLRAANGAPLSATHELRLLRSQVAAMDDELRTLKAQWEAAQPDPRTLMAAHRAAVEKRASVLTDQAHDELADAMAQQQLAFATLQSLVLNAPLYSCGRELFDALHFDTALGLEETDRIGQLRAHFERSMTSIPAAVAHFTKLELDGRAGAGQTNTPQNKVSVTGCADHTLVTSVFVSEIPCPSLERVFNGVLAYFNGLPTALKRHLGTAMDRRRILLNDMETLAHTGRQMALDEELGLRIDDYMQYRRTTIASSVLKSTANTLVCASLRDHRGIFHVDAITDDAQHPFSARETPRWAMAGLTLEPNEARLAVTLRLAIVYRYERLPQDPAVAQEMREHRAILNGDLLMAAVCQHLREATS